MSTETADSRTGAIIEQELSCAKCDETLTRPRLMSDGEWLEKATAFKSFHSDSGAVHINPSGLDETGVLAAYCERSGVLMLIAHLMDALEPDTGAYKQLESLHRMIREGKHQPYIDAAVLESQAEER